MTAATASVAPDPAQIERFVTSLFANANESGASPGRALR